MRAWTILIAIILVSGCSSEPPLEEQFLELKENQFHVRSQWTFRSSTPVTSFYSKMFACWLDEKSMEVRSGGKRNQFPEPVPEVAVRGTNLQVALRETDYNRGRVCFTEVVFFLLEDGSVVQKSFSTNVIQSPKKELHVTPPQGQ